jgi:hypothetical protein
VSEAREFIFKPGTENMVSNATQGWMVDIQIDPDGILDGVFVRVVDILKIGIEACDFPAEFFVEEHSREQRVNVATDDHRPVTVFEKRVLFAKIISGQGICNTMILACHVTAITSQCYHFYPSI